jgi:DNA-binding NarL/FixJ family response regulator
VSRVSLVIDLSAPEYRALVAAATPRGVQAHVLVEQLVRRALTTSRPVPVTAPAPAPKPKPEPTPKSKYVPKPMPNRSIAMIRSDRDEQYVAVTKLHGQGLNDVEIAARLGVSTGTVIRRRNQLHLPPQPLSGRPKRITTNAAPAAEKS